MKIVFKERSSETGGMDFVLSDESRDRMGDVIRADGWELTNFRKNPIALFGHRSDFPIGKWKDLRVEKKRLVGTLELAPEGTSPRIDEINKLVRGGFLKAVSVGFRELESRPFGNDFRDGMEFLRQELVETSVVSVPANPNALQIAKSLGISNEVRALVFDRPAAPPAASPAPSPHDGWTMESYDLACRHLSGMAKDNPYNELWAKWRDEMQQRRADFIRK